MKKIFYLIGISTLFLFASCSNDDVTQSVPEVKLYTPTMQGTFGKLTESNPDITTKSGVIENNPDYVLGEQFYWHHGDRVKLLFFNQDGELVNQLIYTADVPEGKPNRAAFTPLNPLDGVPPGSYTVYGLYPADGWSEDEDVEGRWGVSADPVHWEDNEYIPVEDATSKHLGRYMYMKAKADNVEIGSDGINTLDLFYQHLASVIRIHITNNNPSPPPYPRLFRLSMGVGVGFNSFFNPLEAYLDDIDDDSSWVPVEDSKQNVARVQIVNPDLNGFNFDLFIPILPTGPLDSNIIRFQGRFYADAGDEGSEGDLTEFIDVNTGSVLIDYGFEAGKSYSFNFDVADFFPEEPN